MAFSAPPQIFSRLVQRLDPSVKLAGFMEQDVRFVRGNEAPFHDTEKLKADTAFGMA